MGKLVDANTRGIVINNPSNPCGSNYSRAHLLDIIAFAERYKLPIIADEIYGERVTHSLYCVVNAPLTIVWHPINS
jgi:tyrosine aminotransferase